MFLMNHSSVFMHLFLASLSALSTPIGCILGGYIMDTIGKKIEIF